jgi:hypothetical protein
MPCFLFPLQLVKHAAIAPVHTAFSAKLPQIIRKILVLVLVQYPALHVLHVRIGNVPPDMR